MKLMELYKEKIVGAIRGLDRIRFRSTLRWHANESGMRTFLSSRHILLKDFKQWAEGFTCALRKSCDRRAEQLGIPIQYIRSGSTDKEKLARCIAEERGAHGPYLLI